MTQLSAVTILAQGAQSAPPSGGLGMFLPLIILFAIFYMIILRPQQRKEKERRKEIADMTAGKRVLFSGGIIGKVTEVKSSTFMVEVSSGVVIEIAKGSVLRILPDGEASAADLEQNA